MKLRRELEEEAANMRKLFLFILIKIISVILMTQCIVTLIKVTCEIWSFPGDNVPYTKFGNTITAPIHTEEEFMMLFTMTIKRMKLVLSGIKVHPGPKKAKFNFA